MEEEWTCTIPQAPTTQLPWVGVRPTPKADWQAMGWPPQPAARLSTLCHQCCAPLCSPSTWTQTSSLPPATLPTPPGSPSFCTHTASGLMPAPPCAMASPHMPSGITTHSWPPQAVPSCDMDMWDDQACGTASNPPPHTQSTGSPLAGAGMCVGAQYHWLQHNIQDRRLARPQQSGPRTACEGQGKAGRGTHDSTKAYSRLDRQVDGALVPTHVRRLSMHAAPGPCLVPATSLQQQAVQATCCHAPPGQARHPMRCGQTTHATPLRTPWLVLRRAGCAVARAPPPRRHDHRSAAQRRCSAAQHSTEQQSAATRPA